MQFVIVLLIAAAVFGVCYLVDKGFSKAFRGKAQHRSGMDHIGAAYIIMFLKVLYTDVVLPGHGIQGFARLKGMAATALSCRGRRR